jgi:hypothetical protein
MSSIRCSHALFRAEFVLLPDGTVEMRDDAGELSQLPLLVDYFDERSLRRRRSALPSASHEGAEESS